MLSPFKRNLTKKLISEKLHSIITSSSGMLEITVFGDTEFTALVPLFYGCFFSLHKPQWPKIKTLKYDGNNIFKLLM